MLKLMYVFLLILSFVMLALLISRFRGKISVYYVLLFSGILVSNFGYMQVASAENVQAALYGNQAVYLGACYTPYFFLMCVSELCKVQVRRRYQALFIIFSSFLFTLISTIGVVDWYYKGVSLEQKYGISNLVKEYGPLHNLYPIYLIIVLGVGLAFTISAIQRKKDVSFVTSYSLLSSMIVIIVIYACEKFMHLHIEMLPIGYAIAQLQMIYLLGRISFYDVMVISTAAMHEDKVSGVVVCDSKMNFLGGDEVAKAWFPELKELHIDKEMDCSGTEFLQQLENWITGTDEFESEHFERDGRIIEAKHSVLKSRQKREVHCISLRDDTKQQKYMQFVEQYNENLAKDVDEKTSKIRRIQEDIIISMASIVENRDNNTGGHIARTSDVVRIFVKYLKEKGCCEELTEEMADCVVRAAPLHDFGKIAIPDRILNKPGKFEPEEYEEMKKHSAKGAVIVERILQNAEDTRFKEIAVNVAHYHHEKWDGKGYPEGIKETQIPFEARVMALADVFDALVSKRVYKDSFGYDRAFQIIEESCGTHFDPHLCEEFLKCRPQLEELYNSYED